MKYLSVEEAIDMPGLRLVLTAGVPGPWSESAKAIMAYKGLAFTPVLQQGGGENEALRNWTGQTSAPVAVYDNLPPACHWLDLLMLAERLAPDTPWCRWTVVSALPYWACRHWLRGLTVLAGTGACKCWHR